MKVSTLFAVASTTCCSAFTLPASSRRNTAWSKTRFRAQRSYEDKNASCSKRKSTTTELSANQQQQRQNASWLSSGFAMVMFGMNAMTAAPSSAFADELFIEASIPEPSLSKCECGNNNGASALLAEKKSSSPIVTAVEDSVKKDKAELESVSIPLSAGKAVVVEAISNEIKTDKHDDEKLQKLASNEVRAADPIVAAKSPLPSPSIEKSVTVVEEKKDESASKALIAAAGDHNGDTIVKSNADISLKYDTESINGGKESSSLTADVKSDANTNSGKGESLVASKPTVEDPSVKNLSASIVPAVITEKEVFSDDIIQPTPVSFSMETIAKVEEMSDKMLDKEEKIVVAKVEEKSDKAPEKVEKKVVIKVEKKSDKVPEKEGKIVVAKVEEKSDKVPEKEEKKGVAQVEEKSDKAPEKDEKKVVAKVEEKSDKAPEKEIKKLIAKVEEKSDKAPEKEEKKVVAKVEEKSDKLPEKEEKKVIAKVEEKKVVAKVEEKSDKASGKEEKKVVAKVEEKSDKLPEKEEKIVVAKVEKESDKLPEKEEKKSPEQISPELYKLNRLQMMTLTPQEEKKVVAEVEEMSDKAPGKEEKIVVAKVEGKSDKVPEKEVKKVVVAKVEEKSDKAIENEATALIAKTEDKSSNTLSKKEDKMIVAKVEEKSVKVSEKKEDKVAVAKIEVKHDTDTVPAKEPSKMMDSIVPVESPQAILTASSGNGKAVTERENFRKPFRFEYSAPGEKDNTFAEVESQLMESLDSIFERNIALMMKAVADNM